MRFSSRLLSVLLAMAAVSLMAIPAAGQTANGPRTVPDVIQQYDYLKHHGEWIGFHMGAETPDPSPFTGADHWQGMGRYQDSENTPYLIVSLNSEKNSGNPGGLAIVRMDSREQHGERMRSNRLARDTETEDTAPPPDDEVVKWLPLSVEYDHPGGMQIIGDIVAVAMMEAGDGHPDPPGKVMFVDLSGLPDVNAVELLPETVDVIGPEDATRIGAVGITQLQNGRFLLVVQNGKGKWLHFFRSEATSYDGLVEDLADPSDQAFFWLDTWHYEEIIGRWYWEEEIVNTASFQTINLVTQDDGRVFMIGARNDNKAAPFFGPNRNNLQLYEVENFDGSGEIVVRTRLSEGGKRMHLSNSGSGDNGNFNAASGLYISPTGELIFYAAEHDNDGPPGGANGFVRMAEFRYGYMAREDSPLLLPAADAGGGEGGYTVEEGSTVVLDGSGSGPSFIKPWVELYEHDHFGGRSLVLDWDDRDLEDWQDFGKLDGGWRGFHDQASSVVWQAPHGCDIGLYEHDNFGGKVATLVGDGTIHYYLDMGLDPFDGDNDCSESLFSSKPSCIGDDISSMRFLGTDSACEQIGALNFLWSNLTPEVGTFLDPPDDVEIEFAGWDGPSLAEIELTVCSLAAQCDIAVVTIPVSNVAPVAGIDTLVDELGNIIGIDLPGVLAGLRLDIQGAFTDAGTFDTHTAVVDWGDSYSSDVGSVVATISAGHIYMAAGERMITMAVTDDDGGVGMATTNVTVLDGAATTEISISSLKGILTGSHVGGAAAKALRKALAKLEGNGHHTEPSGALELLQYGHFSAALEKIRQAISCLNHAEELDSGLDLSEPKSLLAMTAKSVAMVEINRAATNPGVHPDLITEAEKLVAQGDKLLAVDDYYGAVGKYEKALIIIQLFPDPL